MNRRACVCMAPAMLIVRLSASAAEAKSPRVHITGPTKERAQTVQREFVIGVSASSFDVGRVEIDAPGGCDIFPMERRKTNDLNYTPTQAGDHTITAVVMVNGNSHRRTSSITKKCLTTLKNNMLRRFLFTLWHILVGWTGFAPSAKAQYAQSCRNQSNPPHTAGR